MSSVLNAVEVPIYIFLRTGQGWVVLPHGARVINGVLVVVYDRSPKPREIGYYIRGDSRDPDDVYSQLIEDSWDTWECDHEDDEAFALSINGEFIHRKVSDDTWRQLRGGNIIR